MAVEMERLRPGILSAEQTGSQVRNRAEHWDQIARSESGLPRAKPGWQTKVRSPAGPSGRQWGAP